LELPGYQGLVYKNRTTGNGGGVGFYVRHGINFKIIEPPFRSFVNKVFESLTIEISDSSNRACKHYIISNVYRSPTLARGYTVVEQYNEFSSKFEQLLEFLNSSNKNSYVLLDSNINLLNLDNNQTANSYIDIVCNNSFL
jgi:uncharacterized protein YcgL (UPF0745 family)